MGKLDNRQLIGTRMRASEIKRMRRRLDEEYGRIVEGVCPVCGAPIRKPKRGPTARFCSEKCRKTYIRKKQAMSKFKKEQAGNMTLKQLRQEAMDYRERADRLWKRSLFATEETKRIKSVLRITCMLQLKTILEYGPGLIEQAATGGYVVDLMNEIDQYGMPGDANRLLGHLGYTGSIPQKTGE